MHSKLAIWVGGKHSSNARSKPTFHKLVGGQSPQQPAALAGGEEVVLKILYAYKENGKPWERMGEWIDRIGWPRFFELTGLAFHKVSRRQLARFPQQPECFGANLFLEQNNLLHGTSGQ